MPVRLPFLFLIISLPLYQTFSSHDCSDHEYVYDSAFVREPTEFDESGIIEVLLQSKTYVNASIRIDVYQFDGKTLVTAIKERKEQNVTLLPNEPTLLTFPYLHSIYAGLFGNVFGIRTETMKLKNGTEYWHEDSIVLTQTPQFARELPYPFTGFSIRLVCFPGWKSELCNNYCDADIADLHGMRCDSQGHLRCKKGYCGIDCKKSGSKCPAYKYCNCENGGECFLERAMGMEHVYCECPQHLYGVKCNESRMKVRHNGFNKVVRNYDIIKHIDNTTGSFSDAAPKIIANLSVAEREIWKNANWGSNRFLNITNIDFLFEALQTSGKTNHSILTCLLFVFVSYLYRCA